MGGTTCCNQPGGGGTCWFGASCDHYCKVDENCSISEACFEGKCWKRKPEPEATSSRTGSDLDPRSSPSSTTTEAPSAENSDDSSYDATTRSSSSSTTTETPSTTNSDDSS